MNATEKATQVQTMSVENVLLAAGPGVPIEL
jgi:hypothetical protein